MAHPLLARVRTAKVVAIFRRMPVARLVPLADALVEAGITALEITFGSEDTTRAIRDLGARYQGRVIVGAGTVTTIAEYEAARSAGAEFFLSPHFDPALVRHGVEHEDLYVPGVTTPSEIWAAHQAGAELLKLFPAGSLGPDYLRDLKGPFRDLEFLPTGGISGENGAAFLKAGALALGMGSQLVPSALVNAGDFEAVRRHVAGILAALA